MTFRQRSGVDGALGYFTSTNIKRYQAQHKCSILEAKYKIGNLCIDEALKHVVIAKDIAKIMMFQRRHDL